AINPEEIEDKSKGDVFSKTISILQLAWFIVQCIARATQHLPITLLEMTALAFASLSIITYFLWWYKPLNVKYHICLDNLDLTPACETRYQGNLFPVWCMLRTRSICLGYYAPSVAFTHTGAIRISWMVPTVFTLVGVGLLFGAFHSLAWSFYFPSHAEMVLWRVSVTGIFIGTIMVGHMDLVLLIVSFFNKNNWLKILTPISDGILVFYIVARIILIILAFLQLRALPPFTFCTVQWTTYIPHL
ncbi:hypothetical protein F5146DRAFT_921541, partial [Armillaria mellea]